MFPKRVKSKIAAVNFVTIVGILFDSHIIDYVDIRHSPVPGRILGDVQCKFFSVSDEVVLSMPELPRIVHLRAALRYVSDVI